MAKYTRIPENTFKELQMNAGILVDSFDPTTGEVGNLIGATTGGIQFADTPEYSDFGEDIDNCPKNTMELKKMDSREVVMSGTFVSVTAKSAKMLSGSADVDPFDETHIIPRRDLLMKDFSTIWFVGDYSNINTGANAGFLAIKLFNALNTSGFAIQTGDKAKGTFSFSFTGHYSMDAQDIVPYEIYVKAGEDVPVVPSIAISPSTLSLGVGATGTLTAVTVPEGATVVWTSSDETIATVNKGTVTGVAEGSTTIVARMNYEGEFYTASCDVTVASTVIPALTGLTIGALTLVPEFDTETTEYTATTTNATNTITATVSAGGTATITVNDVEIENGGSATWEEGENTVKVVVGGTTYTVTVTKE